MHGIHQTAWHAYRRPCEHAGTFAELAARHGGLVFGTCRRVLKNEADAQEVAQECFIELMRTRRGVRKSLAAWLHTAALHRSLDRIVHFRHHQHGLLHYAAVLAHLDILSRPPSGGPGMPVQAPLAELRELLIQLLRHRRSMNALPSARPRDSGSAWLLKTKVRFIRMHQD